MFKNLYIKYKNENIAGKFIYINIAIYILLAVIGVFTTLFNAKSGLDGFLNFFELPASFLRFVCQPWSLFTYMFLHGDFVHILFNMLALYGFGRIFLQFFSSRHFVGVYLLGGIAGGVFFMLSYNLFPYFSGAVERSYLLGASASVLAIVVASAVRRPDCRVNVMLLGSMRLVTIAVITVVVSLLLLTSDNAGGNFAHLGGAFAGWLFAFLLDKGVDMTLWINRTIDFFATLLKKRPARKRAKFTYQKNERTSDYEYNARKRENEAEIDEILEKVKTGGYVSLTDEEKKRLFDASGR